MSVQVYRNRVYGIAAIIYIKIPEYRIYPGRKPQLTYLNYAKLASDAQNNIL